MCVSQENKINFLCFLTVYRCVVIMNDEARVVLRRLSAWPCSFSSVEWHLEQLISIYNHDGTSTCLCLCFDWINRSPRFGWPIICQGSIFWPITGGLLTTSCAGSTWTINNRFDCFYCLRHRLDVCGDVLLLWWNDRVYLFHDQVLMVRLSKRNGQCLSSDSINILIKIGLA